MRHLLIAGLIIAITGCGPSETAKAPAPIKKTPVVFDGGLSQQAAAQIVHGERLTWVLGCRGCHGAGLQGERFYELYASNLTTDLRRYSDAQLERLMRDGLHPTGREVWAMPSELFQHLSSPDMTALVAFLRTLEPAGPATGKRLPFTPETRQLIDQGKLKPAADFVRETRNIGPVELGDAHALGRYITRVTCAECHGAELKGGDTPDLIVAGTYSRDEFERLMTEGVPTGGRKLKPLMEQVSKERFAKMTLNERDALYDYLKARAEQPQ